MSIITNVSHYASPPPPINSTTFSPTTLPESGNISSVRTRGNERLIASAESDPRYASQMAETLAKIPDKMMVNLNEAPPLSDPEAFNAWANQSAEFDKEAAPVTAKRMELFNSMKSQGASGIDMLKAIIAFNDNLPADYQIKTGALKVDTFA